jgi:hypothetical protein
MARKKNCTKNRLANLPKQPSKPTHVSKQATVEDVTDSESECDPDFEDRGAESEIETESNNEETALKEIRSDSELLEFTLRLQGAHDQMVMEEKAKRAAKKRKATYLGNSARSKRRWCYGYRIFLIFSFPLFAR